MAARPKARRPTREEGQFIEETGLLYEEFGLPRMAGRVLGWLLICDPPQQSLAEIGEVLQASKASISTMTRMLIQMGIARRITVPGDRRDYVAIPAEMLPKLVTQQVQRATAIRQLFARGLGVVAGRPPELQERVRVMHDLYAFFERELPALMTRWERDVKKRK